MQRKLKRLFDLVAAALLMVVLSPVLAIAAICVRLSMGGPVLFRQMRPGQHERPFEMLKFRTMREPRVKEVRELSDARRLTRVGAILRKTSIDELPGLWNVLRGDMSLVGPRPLLMQYLPYYSARERLRFVVPPGITGWAQVRGRNLAAWDDRLACDVWYVEHWSLWLDMRILLMTVRAVAFSEGVVVDPRAAALNLDEARRGSPARRDDEIDSTGN